MAGKRWIEHGLVFPSPIGTPLDESNVLRLFQTVCKDNDLPIRVFSIMEPGNLRRALQGEQIGTLIR